MTMQEKVEAALEQLRPALKVEGDDVELVKVDEDVVILRLGGNCSTRDLGILTLQHKVEHMLKEQVPEIKKVVAI